MQRNGIAKKRKQELITMRIKPEVFEEFRDRANQKEMLYSEYLKNLMDLETASGILNDGAFATPLLNLLKKMGSEVQKKEAEAEQRQAFRW